MWKKLYDLVKQAVTFGQQLQRHQKTIETQEQQIRQLTVAVQEMYFEMRRTRDEFRHFQETERHEREKLLLQLENERLKRERHLPSAPPQQNE